MNNHRFTVTVSKIQLSAYAATHDMLDTSPDEVLEVILESFFSSADVTEVQPVRAAALAAAEPKAVQK